MKSRRRAEEEETVKEETGKGETGKMDHPLNKKDSANDRTGPYRTNLKRFISNRVRSVEDAEDIFQEVMYQVAKADFLMQPIEKLEAWIYSVAKNKIIDSRRKKRDLPVADLRQDSDEEETEAIENIEDILFEEASTTDEVYLQDMVWEELEKALSELPTEQKDAFVMSELDGLSFKEMSKRTGITENTLISRKRYAVMHLREKLKKIYSEFTDVVEENK
ncbi:MAG: RNA polymerase sigma factor [Bacteroidales bacterium]|jgi:RNA polymerase sigma factor (sigma-70 family)|nr:RNA polymerase sigma factor [Bacteroidales bacterium]